MKREQQTDKRSGVFFLVAGTGHCGTKWLAQALNHPQQGIECFHEEKLNWITQNWQECLEYEAAYGVAGLYRTYFAFIHQELQRYAAVGDSHSWEVNRIPEVNAWQPIDRLILLVRNGIQTVNSLYYWTRGVSPDDVLYTDQLRWYWTLIGSPGGDWNQYTPWARWCWRWRANQATGQWLEQQLQGQTSLRVVRLEDMVADVEALADLITWLHPDATPDLAELRRLQVIDVNRKMRGDRSPEAIWDTWSAEQRAVFAEICGPAMDHYGYEWPRGAAVVSVSACLPGANAQVHTDQRQIGQGPDPIRSDHAHQEFLSHALVNHAPTLAANADRIRRAVEAIGHPGDLGPPQWVQLMAFMLEFEPEVAVDLGRGWGNSTAALMMAANLQKTRRLCRVISICRSDAWQTHSSLRLAQVVPADWFDLLEVHQADILTFDFAQALGDARSILVFWDTNRFDVAECVLGRLLPLLAKRRHVVAVHDISDVRYSAYARAYGAYGKHRLWRMEDSNAGGLVLGDIWSSSEDVVAIAEFVSRNSLTLFSGDHSLRSGAVSDPDSYSHVRRELKELFSMEAHWRWFSLNEVKPPYTFPAWETDFGSNAEMLVNQRKRSALIMTAEGQSAGGDNRTSVCDRLGRMLNRPGAVPTDELYAAAAALQAILSAPDPAQFVVVHRDELPAATLPLLIVNLATAWADGNQPLGEVLERLYGLLTA